MGSVSTIFSFTKYDGVWLSCYKLLLLVLSIINANSGVSVYGTGIHENFNVHMHNLFCQLKVFSHFFWSTLFFL